MQQARGKYSTEDEIITFTRSIQASKPCSALLKILSGNLHSDNKRELTDCFNLKNTEYINYNFKFFKY